MSIRKLVFSTIFLVVLIAFFGVGIISILKGNEYTNNDIMFEIVNEVAYSSIEGWYYLGQDAINNNQPTSHYEKVVYEQTDEYSAETADQTGFPKWDIGESLMEYDDGTNPKDIDIVKIVIEVENRNKEIPITLSLKNVGVHETTISGEKTSLCYTRVEYAIDNNNEVVYDNQTDTTNEKCERVGRVLNVNGMLDLPVNKKARVIITFTRNTRSETFEIVNNFTLQLTAEE